MSAISYTLPDFVNNLGLNMFFVRLSKNHPELFIDDVEIESMYGCFPSCILNGGRAFVRERYTKAQIEETFELLSEYNLLTRLTFTNMLAESKHLDDEYVASILDVARNYHTEIIVYSDELAHEIENRFGLKCVLSTTRNIPDTQTLNHALNEYEYVVLDYNHAKDNSFLSCITQPEKLEVMVNEFCRPGCPHREQHYLHHSEDQMNNTSRFFPCDHQDGGAFYKHESGHPVYFVNDEVRHLFNTFGITQYKIVGRGIPFETVVESYAYYLIKPEFRNEVKQAVALSRRS